MKKDKNQIDFVDLFPEELTFEIFGYLEIETLGKIARVNSDWKRISEDALLWKRFVWRDYKLCEPMQCYKTVCRFVRHFKNSSEAVLLLKELQSKGLLRDELLRTLFNYKSLAVVSAVFALLVPKGLFTLENIYSISQHIFPMTLANAFLILAVNELYDPTNRSYVIHHSNPSELAEAFGFFNQHNMLSEGMKRTLVRFHKPYQLIQHAVNLDKYHLFSEEHCYQLFNRYRKIYAIFRGIELLNKAKICDEANLDLLFNHEKILFLLDAMYHLHRENILTENYFSLVVNSRLPVDIANGLTILQTINLLLPGNVSSILKNVNPHKAAVGLYGLKRNKLLFCSTRALLEEHYDPINMAEGVRLLREADILLIENCRVLKLGDPVEIAQLLILLSSQGLLNDKNRALVEKYSWPTVKLEALEILAYQNALIQDYFEVVVQHKEYIGAANAILKLHIVGKLPNDLLDMVSHSEHPEMLSRQLKRNPVKILGKQLVCSMSGFFAQRHRSLLQEPLARRHEIELLGHN